ncbi:MAG: leucine-rich repeat domain-containing protein [Pirellulaceae bacterium]
MKLLMSHFARLIPFVAAVLCYVAGPLTAQSVFPDKALEAAVRKEVFAKRFNEEPITADDVKNISQVVAKGKGITSLEGLQHCTAIMLIDLENNQIADLAALKELKQLQSVNLAGNQIESIEPMAGLTAMQYLELSRNKVKDIAPVKAMTNMRSLYLSDNQITTLEPVQEFKKIWTLYAARNPISDFAPVGQLKWLSSLDLQGCQIKDLSFLKPLTELRYLMLVDNQLADLGPLVEMCNADAQGDKRFAPFLKLYLHNNPLSDAAKNEQLAKLKEIGVRLNLDPIKK